MIRLSHQRCQEEMVSLAREIERLEDANAVLADENKDLVDQVDDLSDDLNAAEHALDEVIAACRDLDYAATEATIPDLLRERLMRLAALTEPDPEVEFLTA